VHNTTLTDNRAASPVPHRIANAGKPQLRATAPAAFVPSVAIKANMIRQIFVLVVMLVGSVKASAQPEQTSTFDWQKPEYAQVRAYLYGVEQSDYQPYAIIIEGRLDSTVQDTTGILLNAKQTTQFLTIVRGKPVSFPEPTSLCFYPHHGIVFYEKAQRPVAHLSICFQCSIYRSFPHLKLPAYREVDMAALEKFIRQLGLPVFPTNEHYYGYARQFKPGVDTTQPVYSPAQTDLKPEFTRGKYTLLEYLRKKSGLPVAAQETSEEITFSFIVEQNGEITGIRIEQGWLRSYNTALVSALSVMPNWVPGQINGNKVRVRVQQKVYFD